jgi:hypothetical protein
MPNGVTYSDEKTFPKALQAIVGNNEMELMAAFAVVNRLQDAGILFREEVPAESRAARKTAASEVFGGVTVNGDVVTPDNRTPEAQAAEGPYKSVQ